MSAYRAFCWRVATLPGGNPALTEVGNLRSARHSASKDSNLHLAQRKILEPRRIRIVEARHLDFPPEAGFRARELLDTLNGAADSRIDGVDYV